MDGFIHSTESFGTVDGPGVRFVIFMQGCPMRCKYCHNPDTWEMNTGTVRSAQSLIDEFERNRSFYKSGGLTVTGGEALLQVDFLLELFALAKQKQIHTCLDTSGITYNPDNAPYLEKLDRLMTMTDLVMLDIKHIDPDAHKALTGHDNRNILAFAEYLAQRQIPVWIRHVIVPGITDDEGALTRLGQYLAKLPNIKALDVLPYHTMGITKYRQLGIDYPLDGVEQATPQQAVHARKIILSAFTQARRQAQSQ